MCKNRLHADLIVSTLRKLSQPMGTRHEYIKLWLSFGSYLWPIKKTYQKLLGENPQHAHTFAHTILAASIHRMKHGAFTYSHHAKKGFSFRHSRHTEINSGEIDTWSEKMSYFYPHLRIHGVRTSSRLSILDRLQASWLWYGLHQLKVNPYRWNNGPLWGKVSCLLKVSGEIWSSAGKLCKT